MEISDEERRYLFSVARKAIEARFSDESKYYAVDIPERLKQRMGVFVTLRKHGELRGCIGYPLPVETIAQAVADNAVNAAFHDLRFPSLRKEELKSLEIEITVLTEPKTLNFKTPDELLEQIEIGRDGLIAELGQCAGLLLPQVPVEEKWDKKTYLRCLCQKAGLPADAWIKRPVRIKTFLGIVLHE